jgi:hypothetical protein
MAAVLAAAGAGAHLVRRWSLLKGLWP